MKTFNLCSFLLAVALFAACGNANVPSITDFDTVAYAPAHASGFDIRSSRKNGSDPSQTTLITIRNPWQGASGVEQYLLVLRENAKRPADFPGQVVKAPVHSVVCMSSSHVAMFDAIGQIRRVKGVSGIDYLSNAFINEHRLCGEVRDVGYDTNINFELLAAMRPDIVLLYGVTGEDGVLTGKLRELGIPYLYIGDYMEQTPLGKAEWLMVAAELCDCRDEGRTTFDNIAERYHTLARQVDSQLQAAPGAVRPKVLLNTPYRDTWFLPSAGSYMVQLIRDAGGDTFTAAGEGNSSLPVDLEQAYLLASSADFWLNTGSCNSLEELTAQNPKFAAMPVVRRGRVWNNNRRQTPAGGSDFWESGVVHPDLVLQDLVRILHPEIAVQTMPSANAADSVDTYYYKRLE